MDNGDFNDIHITVVPLLSYAEYRRFKRLALEMAMAIKMYYSKLTNIAKQETLKEIEHK